MWQASANRNMGTWDDITGGTAGALRLNMVAFACGVGIWDKCLVWFHLSEVYLEAYKNKGLFSTKNESHWAGICKIQQLFPWPEQRILFFDGIFWHHPRLLRIKPACRTSCGRWDEMNLGLRVIQSKGCRKPTCHSKNGCLVNDFSFPQGHF